MRIVTPTNAFQRFGRRYTLYMWKWRKLRFIRLPAGHGLYIHLPHEMPLALEESSGARYRLALPPYAAATPYFRAFADFAPLQSDEMKQALTRAEWRTATLAALSNRELSERYGDVPVTAEDAYSAGNCWYGSAQWGRELFSSNAPTVRAVLASLDTLPTIERPRFLSAAVYAIAYVIGDRNEPVPTLTPESIAEAIANGWKADGSGALRLPALAGIVPGGRRASMDTNAGTPVQSSKGKQ